MGTRMNGEQQWRRTRRRSKHNDLEKTEEDATEQRRCRFDEPVKVRKKQTSAKTEVVTATVKGSTDDDEKQRTATVENGVEHNVNASTATEKGERDSTVKNHDDEEEHELGGRNWRK